MTPPTLAELIVRVEHDGERVGGGGPSNNEWQWVNCSPGCPRCALESWHTEALGMVPEIRSNIIATLAGMILGWANPQVTMRWFEERDAKLDAAIADALAKRLGERK